jgi:hypothetical protein
VRPTNWQLTGMREFPHPTSCTRASRSGSRPGGLLEPIHAALDPIALGIDRPVGARPAALVGPGGDHRADPPAAQLRPHARIRVALVGSQPLRPLARPTPSGTASRAGPPDRPGIQQRWLQRGLVPLPGGDQDRQRPPTALNAQMQLAAQPAAAAPQGLILRRCTSPLRSEVAWDHIQASIEGGLESCTRPLAYALPQCTPRRSTASTAASRAPSSPPSSTAR